MIWQPHDAAESAHRLRAVRQGADAIRSFLRCWITDPQTVAVWIY